MEVYHYYTSTGAPRTHREGSIRIDLILGTDAKAGVAVSSCPGQIDSCLQLIVHLLVDGPAKLSAVISEENSG